MLVIEVIIHVSMVLYCMFSLNWKLAFVPLATMILCGTVAIIMERKLDKIYEDISEENAVLTTVAEENLAGVLDIYPAREEPIPGVTSQIIFDAVTIADKRLIRKEELLDVVAAEAGNLEVVLMVGAGNIELLVDPVKQILDKKE